MDEAPKKTLKVALLTNVISPHQIPLARNLVALLGEGNYHYVYTEACEQERTNMGWPKDSPAPWCFQGEEMDPVLQEADILFSENRALDLFEARLKADKLTCYVSERWFKPPLGFFRLLVPSYLKMARRWVRLLHHPKCFYFPQGIHAARDMLRMAGLFSGHLGCFFGAPKVAFESRPGGVIVPLKVAWDLLGDEAKAFAQKHGFAQIPPEHWGKVKATGFYAKLRLWGYFVAPGQGGTPTGPQPARKVLWVGRMLDWKRVETLVQACREENIALDLYGHGPQEAILRKLAEGWDRIQFHDFVPVEQVRDLMRDHDTYVLPSDGGEGWGAVVNEALEEGMQVFAALETGAGGTILPPSHLFKAQDVTRLRGRLTASLSRGTIGPWTAQNAAHTIIAFGKGEE